MSKRPETRVALEKLLKDGQAKNQRKVFRDRRRRAVLVHESSIDYGKLRKAGRSFGGVGRRIRCFDATGRNELASWVLPIELTSISVEEPEAVAGLELPLGTVVNSNGLWLKYKPGLEEVGVNDRGDVILREVKSKDPLEGPVVGAVNTVVSENMKRVVARLDSGEQDADRKEADAWLRLLTQLEGKRPLRHTFKCAGIDFEHRGNVAHLHRTTQLNFFDVRDIDMVRIASLMAFRFRKLRRKVPSVQIISLMGVPAEASSWNSLLRKAKRSKKKSATQGIPDKIQESRFFDASSKRVVPSSFVCLSPLKTLPDKITVITVNTDHHSEIKARGVLSPLGAILSLIDVISAHASVAVLDNEGLATAFMGPTGAGKTTACTFWAEKNEKFRRDELRRRYETEIRRTPDAGRLGEDGLQKELDKIMARVGILCQEDCVGLLKEGAGQWTFWPTERMLYARSSRFPGLRYILAENHPLIENATVDFGGSGDPELIGRVAHSSYPERFFYDPDWNHLGYDRTSRRIRANVYLERDPTLAFCARRVTAKEAVDLLLAGRTPGGRFEPMCNPSLDFCATLERIGVVGEDLAEAYETAKNGDCGPLGAGDAALGAAIFEKLDLQAKLWLDNFREVPTFVVNTAHGLELTQDILWLLSEHSDLFDDWRQVTLEEFRGAMKERYGVTYGARGEWTHIGEHERRGA